MQPIEQIITGPKYKHGVNRAEALLTKPIDFGMLRSDIDMRVEGDAKLPNFGAVQESCYGPLR